MHINAFCGIFVSGTIKIASYNHLWSLTSINNGGPLYLKINMLYRVSYYCPMKQVTNKKKCMQSRKDMINGGLLLMQQQRSAKN